MFYLGLLVVGIGAGYLVTTAKFADLHTFQKRDLANIEPFDYEYAYDQTFVSESANLYLIEFPVISRGYPQGYIFYMSIRLTDAAGREIASEEYQIPRSAQVDTVRFSFPSQTNSFHKEYHLVLQTDAPPRLISLLGSEYDSYPAGELVSKDRPTDPQDLAFFTYGKPSILILIEKTIRASGGRMTNLILITIIFWGLGSIVTCLYLPDQGSIERGIQTLLTGIALPPVLFFIFSLLKIRFTNLLVPAVIVILIIGVLLNVLTFRKKIWNPETILTRWREIVVLCILFVIAIATRVVQINDLIVPNGIDAQFHENTIERISRTGETALDSIYHLGFHADAFLVSEVTNDSIPESILLYGQWLSITAGLSLYLLARNFFGDWIYAIAATAFYWFISPFPAYLMNIARYPFLQGFVLLPWAGLLIWNNRKHQSPNEIMILIALCGLFLSHYGSMAILVIVITSFMILEMASKKLPSFKTAHTTRFLAVSAVVMLIVFTKLYYVLAQGSWGSFLASKTIAFTFDDYEYVFHHTLRQGGILLWCLGFLGGILYFVRNRRRSPLVFLCLAGLLSLDWLQMSLLGHSATRPANTFFALAIPLSLFSGFCLEYLIRNRTAFAVVSIFILALAGAYNIAGIVNPSNMFYSFADQSAMDWIKANTPKESLFLINSYPWDEFISSIDGGYWITYMTGRQTIFANTQEEYDHIEQFIQDANADYVYIGSGYGNINPLVMNRLDKQLVYDANGIYIYRLCEIPSVETQHTWRVMSMK